MKLISPVFHGVLLAQLLASTSCAGRGASPYAPVSGAGGYKETRIAGDTYIVSFHGNSNTSEDEAKRMMLRRAAELTKAQGSKWFGLLDSTDLISSDTVSQSSYIGYTRPPLFWSETFFRPTALATVRLYKVKPAERDVFDAEEVLSYIGQAKDDKKSE